MEEEKEDEEEDGGEKDDDKKEEKEEDERTKRWYCGRSKNTSICGDDAEKIKGNQRNLT